MTYSFHRRSTLFLWLVLFGEERPKEPFLLLHVNFEIFIVVDCTRCQFACLWVGCTLWSTLLSIDSILDNLDGFMPVQEIWMGRIHVTCLHASSPV